MNSQYMCLSRPQGAKFGYATPDTRDREKQNPPTKAGGFLLVRSAGLEPTTF